MIQNIYSHSHPRLTRDIFVIFCFAGNQVGMVWSRVRVEARVMGRRQGVEVRPGGRVPPRGVAPGAAAGAGPRPPGGLQAAGGRRSPVRRRGRGRGRGITF